MAPSVLLPPLFQSFAGLDQSNKRDDRFGEPVRMVDGTVEEERSFFCSWQS
jgi:hypothetical protein